MGQCLTGLELQGEEFCTAEGVGSHMLWTGIVRRREHTVEERACFCELPGLDQGVRFLDEDMVSPSLSQALD